MGGTLTACGATRFRSAAAVNAAAASRDYKVYPRIDYRTITGVEGPLVIMENVKFPTYGAPLRLQELKAACVLTK